jgi:hypothetical protein
MFGCHVKCHVWLKRNTAFEQKNLIPTVKHGGGGIIVWGCFATSGPGQFAIIESTMNSILYQRIIEENVRPSVKKLKPIRIWILKQDNDAKLQQNGKK